MPDILPTINNEPPQGIQALLDTVYLWNPDVANDLIAKVNELLERLGTISGKIPPYSELETPVLQYMPCYDGDNVYVAAQELDELPAELDPTQWILIATKAPILQGGTGIEINGNEISVTSEISSGAAAGSTAVQPGDLGTAAYAASSDFATAAQGALADTAIQSVKTINGNTITGSGNLVITSFASYPAAWPTTGTTKAFCDAIAADTTAVEGMAYLGEVTINDMPAGIVNSEIQVEIMSGTTAANKVILLTLTSGNVAPYRWQYTYWNNGSSVGGWINIGQQVNVDWNSSSGVTQILNKPDIPEVINNYNSTSGTAALSANMGHDLNERLTSVEGRGRFLSTWNCATGLAGTNPPTSPYTYKSGDYFIVSAVGATNYRPSGSQYITGTASTVVETGTVAVNDTYQYDGSNWVLLRNTVDDPLPSQTGNAGKVLTTDGTNAAWSSTVSPLEIQTTDTGIYGQSTKLTFSTVVEGATTNPVVMASNGSGQLIITTPNGMVLDGYTFMPRQNANSRLGFELLKWESIYVTRINNGGVISVPTVGGSMAVQVSSMPTAAATLVGQVYQFIGTTDQDYTNGYFYKCVSDGQNPATYSWAQTNVQPQGATYTAGTGIDITSGVISVTSPTLTNTATGNYSLTIGGSSGQWSHYDVVVGSNASVQGNRQVAIGYNASTNKDSAVAIGANSHATAIYACQICTAGVVGATNNDQGTYKFANNNGNYEMMSADGTIPTDRFTTTPVADGTYVPTLTISSGVATRSWAAPSGAPTVPGTMPTLAVADWTLNSNTNKYEQTVNVTGVTASNVVFVSPAPASTSDWTSSNILCITQGSGTLTFQADSVPANAVTANVVIFG